MRRSFHKGSLAIILMTLGSVIWAAEVTQTEYAAPMSQPPRREITTRATVHATVTKINYKTRMITLKNEAGESSEMEVGPEVQRFNEIKKGDKLVVDYLESQALYVKKAEKGMTSNHDAGAMAARKMDTPKPGAIVAGAETVTAEVMDVDYKARTIKLKGPDGDVVTMHVPDTVKRLKEVKKGDFIVAERTVAVAINVHKP
jgi:hypothetical protein